MTIPLTYPITNSPSMAWATYDREGVRKSENKNGDALVIAKHSDDYYVTWNKFGFLNKKKGLGLGAVVALFEMATAYLLHKVEKSPATFANALTTFGECLQVLISGAVWSNTNLDDIGSEAEKKIKRKNLEWWDDIRARAIAFVVTGAGIGGLYKWGKETYESIKGESHDIHDLAIWQKVSLSTASVLSAVFMGIGWLEKALMAALSKKQNGGTKSEQIILNSHSDWRCKIEWVFMTVFPWIVQLKPVKFLFDLGLPLNALQDGLTHLVEPWMYKDHKHSHGDCQHDSHHAREESKFMKFVKKIFSHDHEIKIPSLYFNNLFMGNNGENGLRVKLFNPIFKAFGCEPPMCFLSKNSDLIVGVGI